MNENLPVVSRATNLTNMQLNSGSAGSPSMSFLGDASTGLWLPTSGHVALAISGINKLVANSSKIEMDFPGISLLEQNQSDVPSPSSDTRHMLYICSNTKHLLYKNIDSSIIDLTYSDDRVISAINASTFTGFSAPAGSDFTITTSSNGRLAVNSESSYPISNNHVATKEYVDNYAAGLKVHPEVKTRTTTALTATYSNGTAGVGATLTSTTNVAIGSVSNYALSVSDRILVADQSTTYQNGIYTVTQLGSVSTPWILTRASDLDGSPTYEVANGVYVFVASGDYLGKGYVLSTPSVSVTGPNSTILIGTDPLIWVQFAGSGTGSLTSNRVLGVDSLGIINSINLSSYITGTSNQVTVTDNGTGGVGLSLPQSIATSSSPTFTGLTLSSTLGVTGATTLSSTLGVTGATTLSSTLGVTGNTTLTGLVAIGGSIANNIIIYNNKSISRTTGSIYGYACDGSLYTTSGTASDVSHIYLHASHTGNAGTITDAHSLYISQGNTAGTITNGYGIRVRSIAFGSTNAYGGYFETPSVGAVRQALYADNLSVGSSTQNLSGTSNLYVAGSTTLNGSSVFAGVVGIGTANASNIAIYNNKAMSATSGTLFGYLTDSDIYASSGTVSDAVHMYINPRHNSNAGTITNAYGFYVETGTTAGTITNGYGIRVMGIAYGGTNTYGAYITAPTTGTNRQALYTDNMSVGYTTASSLTNLNGTNNLIVNGNIGAGLVNPLYKLDINGTMHVTGNCQLDTTATITGIATLSSDLRVNGNIGLNAAAIANSVIYNNKALSGTTGNLHGYLHNASLYASSGSLTNTFHIYLYPNHTGNAGTIGDAYGVYIDGGNTAGTITNGYGLRVIATAYGSTNSYGGYFEAPVVGAVRQALYTANLSVGSTTQNLSGTNNLYVAGATTLASTLNVTGITTLATTSISTLRGTATTSVANDTLYLGTTGGGENFFIDRANNSAIIFGYNYQKQAAAVQTFQIYNNSTNRNQLFTVNTAGTSSGSDFVAVPNGNFGVGNSAPGYKLDVTGTANITGATTLGSTLGVTGAATLSSTLGVTGAATLSSTLGVTGAATLSSSLSVTGAATLNSDLFFGNTNTTIQSSTTTRTTAVNTVGINLSQPVTVTAGNAITNFYGLQIDNIGTVNLNTTGVITNGYALYVKNPAFGTNKYSAKFVGKVGMGTDNYIGAPLEIHVASATDSPGGGLILSRYSADGVHYRAGSIYAINVTGGADTTMCFGVCETSGKNPYLNIDQCRMAITSTGYVGIGTTIPTCKLTLGTINTAGGELIRLNGNNTQSYMTFYNNTTRQGYLGTAGSGAGMIFNCDASNLAITSVVGQINMTANTGINMTIEGYSRMTSTSAGAITILSSNVARTTTTNLYNLYLDNPVTVTAGNTITNYYSLYMNLPTATLNSTGVITNYYGMYIPAPSSGTNKYSAGFGGTVAFNAKIDNSTAVLDSGSTVAANFYNFAPSSVSFYNNGGGGNYTLMNIAGSLVQGAFYSSNSFTSLNIDPNVNGTGVANGWRLGTYYGLKITAGTYANDIWNAYSAYIRAPATGATNVVMRQCLYTDNISVGYLTKDLTGTNNLIVSGNVGIGMNNPSYNLDVTGTTRLTGNALLSRIDTSSLTLYSDQSMSYSFYNFSPTTYVLRTGGGAAYSVIGLTGSILGGQHYSIGSVAYVNIAPYVDGGGTANGWWIGESYGIKISSGTYIRDVYKAYSMYISKPASGATNNTVRQAFYTDNISVGYPNVDLADTNNVLIAGNVSIGTGATPTTNLDINSTTTSTFLRGAYSGGQTLQFIAGANYTGIIQVGVSGSIVFCTASDGNLSNPSGERMRLDNAGNLGLGKTASGYQLDLSTDNARKLTTTTWATGSDVRIKKEITSINLQNALDIISTLNPVAYKYNDLYAADRKINNDQQYYGFIADEVEQVIPESVTVSNDELIPISEEECKELFNKSKSSLTIEEKQSVTGYIGNIKMLNSHNLHIYNIAATKQLIEENKQLKERIAKLETIVSQLLDRLNP